MDLDLENLVKTLSEQKLLSKEFTQWYDGQPNVIRKLLNDLIKEGTKAIENCHPKIISGLMVISSLLVHQNRKSISISVLGKLVKIQEEIPEDTDEKEIDFKQKIRNEVLMLVPDRLKWTMRNFGLIVETIKSYKQVIYVMKCPLTIEEFEQVKDNCPEGAQIFISDWYILEAEVKLGEQTENLLKKWCGEQKATVLFTTFRSKKMEKIFLFTDKLWFYEQIKKDNNSVINIGNLALECEGTPRVSLCRRCSVAYQGFHIDHD